MQHVCPWCRAWQLPLQQECPETGSSWGQLSCLQRESNDSRATNCDFLVMMRRIAQKEKAPDKAFLEETSFEYAALLHSNMPLQSSFVPVPIAVQLLLVSLSQSERFTTSTIFPLRDQRAMLT